MNALVIVLLILIIIIILGLIIFFILKKENSNFIKQTSPTIKNGSNYIFPSIDIGRNNNIAIEALVNDSTNTDPILIESSPDNKIWFDTGIKINYLTGGYYFYNDNFNANYIRFKFINSSNPTVLNIYTTY